MIPHLKISGCSLSAESPTYFIADIAASHDGDLEKAKDLIHSAAEAGADAAKFQNFAADTIVSDYGFRQLGEQLSHQSKWGKSVFEVYQDASMPVAWTPILKETCDKAGIHYFTSPYSEELTQAVAPYVVAWKMGSGDITWHKQIEAMCKDGKPFIMATGASTMEEVQAAVEIVSRYHDHFVLMQCNTNYTARLDESDQERFERFQCINLEVLGTYRKQFPHCVLGLSDHTHGADTVLGAVGLYDARVIEKHYTLDNHAVGPDHPFSMNPETWRDMVQRTRALESKININMNHENRFKITSDFVSEAEVLRMSLGDGIKKIESNEKEPVVLQRRALRVTRDLKAGQVLSELDLFPLRPAPFGSFAPYEVNKILGKVLKRDVPKGDCLMFGDIE